jgi:beta-lactamase class D
MVVRFGRLLRQRRRQQKAQRQRERADSTAAPARTYKVTHLIL